MGLLKALYFQVCSPWSMPMSFLSSLSSDGLQKEGHVLHILPLPIPLFFFVNFIERKAAHAYTHDMCTKSQVS